MKILIINSQRHWQNGWMTKPSSLQVVVEVLKKSGFDVETVEVSGVGQLHRILEKVSADTLIWANAYWVNLRNGKLYGLIEAIERYELPLVGSDLNTLLELLQKDTCQTKLKAAGIPIPKNIILTHQDESLLEDIIANSGLEFPLVLKPTKESRSLGVTLAHNLAEAIAKAKETLQNFPNGNLIIEEFLATDDITCGYLRMGEQEMILPSYNVVEGMDCKTEVFSQYHYTLPPEGERQVCIDDTSTLNQLETYLPAIVDLFNIQTTTRIDGRLDRNGAMSFFDINGLPGLNFPISALVKQCFSHFPKYGREHLFEYLINTIAGDSLLRYNMPLSSRIWERNLFNLESETVLTVESVTV